ncbi:hypothetical protein [Bacterioplanoides sp.]|uniref:hypothetical protein n=1 Tax=Bacterioplanoides sp. TaxID=2066072 RepID=UPI003B5AB723
MKWILSTIFIIFSTKTFAGEPPELWSSIKDLDKSKEACEIQSSFILQSIGLENQIENKYGIYGNVKSNRVVVKCIAISSDKSKLMVAVAGNDRKSVEAVRNKLVKSIN